MILADKIIYLRKKCGWSQEELAERMNVSRQSISKWEGAQSVPDLDKILKMCQVFGVSTDYLLKEEIEEPEVKEDVYEPSNKKHISAEFANEFMDKKKKSALFVGIGAALCVLSPVTLILMSGLSEYGLMKDNIAAAIGLGTLLFLVIIAVVIFVFQGSCLADYEWIQKEDFVLDYGVSGIVENRMKKQRPALTLSRAIGVALCIFGAAILVVTSVLGIGELSVVISLCALLILVACATFIFIRWGNEADAYMQLLQQEDYLPERKRNLDKLHLISGVYWGIMTAIYLAISFITLRWDYTWIIWPVAGVLFGVIACIVRFAIQNKSTK